MVNQYVEEFNHQSSRDNILVSKLQEVTRLVKEFRDELRVKYSFRQEERTEETSAEELQENILSLSKTDSEAAIEPISLSD